MECPNCKLLSLRDAKCCDCGYNFASGRLEVSALSKPRISKLRFLGCNVALGIGVLSLIGGVAAVAKGGRGDSGIAGLFIILGALAYRSRKKVYLGLVSASRIRRAVEIAFILVILGLVLFQNNALARIYIDPIPNVIIPLWVLIAYTWASFGPQRAAVTAR
jgi:hypothetical protein